MKRWVKNRVKNGGEAVGMIGAQMDCRCAHLRCVYQFLDGIETKGCFNSMKKEIICTDHFQRVRMRELGPMCGMIPVV